METMNIAIPNDLAFQIKSNPRYGEGINRKMQMLLTIALFVSKDVSLAKSAELAGYNTMEFIGVLKFLGIPAFVYTDEMYEDDSKFVNAAW